MHSTVIVPCFDEARRLRFEPFRPLLARARVLFVDDGSRDGTAELLAGFCRQGERAVGVLRLPANRGKGEAVRAGMNRALAEGAAVAGYLDADLSTPAAEMARLLEVLDRSGAGGVLGSRVALLGKDIRRHALRHYTGRFYATAASLALGEAIYDTQCGAKAFRAGPALAAALAEPFCSRWAFDVELIGRLLARGVRLVEEPIGTWVDVPGSKLSLGGALRATGELGRIAWRLRRRRER
jgi:glycosyltransferase involved in cell wall biosynthesis